MNGRRSRMLRRRMALALTAKPGAVALAVLPTHVASAATTVTVACDVGALKTAITNANSTPGTTLSLAGGCTYTLTTVDSGSGPASDGLPQVTGIMTIEGNTATITRDSAAPAFRIFDETSTGDLTINHLTISNGRVEPVVIGPTAPVGGAGIQNLGGKLTVNSSAITGNTTIATGDAVTAKGGGILTSGDTTISNSIITGNRAVTATAARSGGASLAGGGGIFAKGGTLKIRNTSLTQNTAAATGAGAGATTAAIGGAIEAFGGAPGTTGPVVTMTGSTLAGNVATATGALTNSAAGGAMGQFNIAGTGGPTISTTISNSTFVGNSAVSTTSGNSSGGAITVAGAPQDSLLLVNSTVAGNSSERGGIDHQGPGTVTLTNTILATNPGGNCVGTVANGGHNISFPASAAPCGTSFGHGDPLLAALADNGGPTQTMALGTGSAAIDTADPAVCGAVQPAGADGVDQRGLPRFEVAADTTCDVGAFEVQPIPALPNAGVPAPTGVPLPLGLLLPAAVAAAAAAAGLGARSRNPDGD